MKKTWQNLGDASPDSASVFRQGHNDRLRYKARFLKLQVRRESTGVYYILCEIILSNRLQSPPFECSNYYVYLAIKRLSS